MEGDHAPQTGFVVWIDLARAFSRAQAGRSTNRAIRFLSKAPGRLGDSPVQRCTLLLEPALEPFGFWNVQAGQQVSSPHGHCALILPRSNASTTSRASQVMIIGLRPTRSDSVTKALSPSSRRSTCRS
jgi:hypothetical protein